MLVKRINKGKSLRIVNLLGLSIIFCCLIMSFAYIKREMSYDRFNEKADRIARFSIQYENEAVDGRNWGFSKSTPLFTDIPEIEDAVFMDKVATGILSIHDRKHVVNDLYFISSNFFEVFSYKLLYGDKKDVLNGPEKAVISERLAKELFGQESPVGKQMELSGRKIQARTVFISGVFENFTETSHFHTDLILNRPDITANDFAYIYLLLHPQANMANLKQQLDNRLAETTDAKITAPTALLMPLKDIHLHSKVLREMEPNGNIYYIYLVIGANILLLLIVLFNLWLNSGLIFSYNRKYYQLLRLNGAPKWSVFKDESLFACGLGIASVLFGGLIAYLLHPFIKVSPAMVTPLETGIIAVLFLFAVWSISLLPVVSKMSATLFLNTSQDIRPVNFSLSNVKFMLIGQYCMVMFIVIVSFGISKQIDLIKTSQVGGKENSILVMKEQPDAVKEKYEILKKELLQYPDIELVTAAMQLPGSAIRDMMLFRKEGESEENNMRIPILVVGDDFLPFFHIKPVAGRTFKQTGWSFQEEANLFQSYRTGNNPLVSDRTEEYIINRKAMRLLGFNSPEEAIGKRLYASGSIGYIPQGEIVGVTDDFTYTTTYEESIPQILLQRKMFLNCIMVKLNPGNTARGMETFNRVWNELIPEYPADYTFLQNVYSEVYHNELNAESLVHIFSLLSLIIANLGLIIIMAFIIKRKTKEIGIRKVNGATPYNIVQMLNNRFIIWISIAFVIAIPASWYVMTRWLENFAHKTQLEWWIYASAGLSVLFISVIAVSLQSWQAANLNPVKSLKSE